MKRQDPYHVLNEISREAVPQDVNLLPGALAQIKRGNNLMKLKNKIALVILAMAVVASVLFVVPGSVSALAKLLGFIPGIGIVDQSVPLRVLVEPVTESRDGFTITVENAVLDSEQTVIIYSVEGLFDAGSSQSNGSLSEICFAPAELRLPDGTVLRVPNNVPDMTWDTGYSIKNTFASIPADIDRATLFLPCLHARLEGQGPENWEVPLSFIAAPSDMTVYPILNPTESTAEPSPVEMTTGINMELESVIPTSTGQMVQISTDWSNNPNILGINLKPEDIKILDINGKEVSFEPSSEGIDQNVGDSQTSVFSYKTAPIDFSGSAQIVVDAASEVSYKSSAIFTFDPGTNRQTTQTWNINKDLEIDGHILRILSISITEIDGSASLYINMESKTGIIAAGVFDTAHPSLSGGGTIEESNDAPNQRFASSFNYEGGLPEGPITLTVTGYTTRVVGPWVLEWMPDATPQSDLPSAHQSQPSCTYATDWASALENPLPIPAELNGKILYEEFDHNNRLMTGHLDGSEIQTLIEKGNSASLSPDGKLIVYMDPDGIRVYDLTTGLSELIPGTGNNSGIFKVFWSPDGQQIGFTGTPYGSSPNIYIFNLDGSTPTLLETSEPIKLMQGWMPDGRIMFITLDTSGPVLKLIDPKNGETTSLFNVPELATDIAVSKDGNRVAFNWLDQSIGKRIVYVYTLDGVQRKPIVEIPGDGFITNLIWGPGSNWLAVEMTWAIPNHPYILGLVNVDTCQIVPVINMAGTISGWLP